MVLSSTPPLNIEMTSSLVRDCDAACASSTLASARIRIIANVVLLSLALLSWSEVTPIDSSSGFYRQEAGNQINPAHNAVTLCAFSSHC
jgi:hypothetical protein